MKKKFAGFCIIAILALMAICFGFTTGSKDVKIEAKRDDLLKALRKGGSGNVYIEAGAACGKVTAVIYPGPHPVNDSGSDPQWHNENGSGVNREGKDVASCHLTQGTDNHSLTLTINNAYPYYQPGFTFVVKNTGSVPVRIQGITGPVWKPAGGGTTSDESDAFSAALLIKDWSFTVANPGEAAHVVRSKAWEDTWASLVNDLDGVRLCRNGTVTVTVDYYFDESLPQSVFMIGTIVIPVVQWNEYKGPQYDFTRG